MKFLEYTHLNRINDFLSHLNVGERTIRGCLEAYSCKHTVPDKKLSFSLENEMLDYLGKSSDTDSSSPAERLISRSSRKTLIYLVLTLYHMYPDYDFSAVKAHQFFTDESWESFEQIFDTYMFDASKEWADTNAGISLLEDLCRALDEVINLKECEIYSYNPDCDADPFLEKGAMLDLRLFLLLFLFFVPGDFTGICLHFNISSPVSRWSFNFFFYNRKLKRVVSFRFCCLRWVIAWARYIDIINESCKVRDDCLAFCEVLVDKRSSWIISRC